MLDPVIFKRINQLFLSSFDNYATINGYRILAQDGSDINIPFEDDDTKILYNSLGSPCCQYHINALYDCLNHVFLDWSIDSATKKQECDALISIINNGHYPRNAIFTADRGYENYNLFAHFIENNLKFAIRVKDINTKSGIMTNISTPEGSFDMTVTRTLTRLQTKEIKANKEKYVFVPSTSKFDFWVQLRIIMK
ncbi:transposase [Allocoprobacillus halotolerans]|uniref:Transposase n=1 Tax=Allocoprobacillus halotolerans TaxID=2944914 RepID=A0ABY5I3L3_9FIRM|nr:transposase [Allocoprobacillus halotolerans]UTY38550.1 transposase [Allocoprobacillus halotolerans]UTY38616.1 transposase [Allocoprobacillus halotolerans]UTY40011.1 transposase [Allocoprobacillus halotolerans]UTY40534.1 transposase [Allocoprobacillus halotolerans]